MGFITPTTTFLRLTPCSDPHSFSALLLSEPLARTPMGSSGLDLALSSAMTMLLYSVLASGRRFSSSYLWMLNTTHFKNFSRQIILSMLGQ